ncbi:hypothetical protein SASPL_131708 [Salvia splendens]|uniref:Protein kinase domain-containing protein n=1 Tax=Salvia splendens TaxID=180675 RepID=A0A8X8ZLU5_SALSN|nr:hypothetical protein SASPL_131708 [Salvia splendens]
MEGGELSHLEDMRGKWQCCEWLKGHVIGSGSFGTVNLAIDTTTGSLFVVKSATTDAGISSLKNEADILHDLDSPYIVKCMGKDGHTLFFEYMGGGSISDMMHKFGGALQEKLIRLYTRQILLGLDFLHRSGIVHSDIKCNNVLVSASGSVKLTDFGCAQRTPPCRGIGALLSGWPPSSSRATTSTSHPTSGSRQGHELPRFPANFSPEGLDFLSKCLDRDPRKRWSSGMLLDHPFLRMGDIALSPPASWTLLQVMIRMVIPFSMKPRNDWEDDQSEASSEDGWITVRTS